MTVGAPLPRRDGALKVTGAARYAADHHSERMLHGVLVGAQAPAGRLLSIEGAAARRLPGVTHVLTHEDFPRLKEAPAPPAASSRLPLQDAEIRHDGEPLALVLAETLEDAEYGATLVSAEIDPAAFIPHPRADGGEPAVPRESPYLFLGSDFEHEDVEAAIEGAAIRHEATYVQPSRHHNPMAPSATLAEWNDGMLTMVDAVQHVYGVQTVMSAVFDLPPGRLRPGRTAGRDRPRVGQCHLDERRFHRVRDRGIANDVRLAGDPAAATRLSG